MRDDLLDWLSFVRADAHVLREWPALFYQHAANQPDSTAPARAAHGRWNAGLENRPWFEWLNKPPVRDACVLTITAGVGAVNCCALSPDRTQVAAGSTDGIITVWSAASGMELARIAAHSSAVEGCLYLEDGSSLLSAARDVRIWDTTTWAVRSAPNGMSPCAGTRDGRWFVLSTEVSLDVYDAATERRTASIARVPSRVDRPTVALTEDASEVISIEVDIDDEGAETVVRRWNTRTGMALATLATLKSFADNQCALSPDGRRLLWTRGFGLKIWDTADGVEIATLPGDHGWSLSCAFSPDGTRIAVGWEDGTLSIWDARTFEEIAALPAHSGSVKGCAYSRDGRFLATGAHAHRGLGAGEVKLWDCVAVEAVGTAQHHHGSAVSGCAFSPDGRQLVSASKDRTLRIWDARTGEHVTSFGGNRDPLHDCDWSPDGRRIVSACGLVGESGLNDVDLCDAASGESAARCRGHESAVFGCAFAPDGREILSASADRTLKVWRAGTGGERLTLMGHTDQVRSCAPSPDGRLVASASLDGTVRLWDLANGSVVAVLDHEGNSVTDVAFSPDGSLLAAATRAGSVRLWDTRSFQHVRVIAAHRVETTRTRFSVDGRRLLSASVEKTIKVWDVATGALVTAYVAASGVNGLAVGPAWTLAAGDELGNIYLLALRGIDLESALATPVRLFDLELAEWQDELTVRCPHCRARLTGVAAEPVPCSHCGKPCELTGFTVDRREAPTRDIQLMGRSATALDEPAVVLAFSPDGSLLAREGERGGILITDTSTGLPRTRLSVRTAVASGAWSPDGRFIACGLYGGMLAVWHVGSRRRLRSFRLLRPPAGPRYYVLGREPATPSVKCCAWSPDGWLVTAGSDSGGSGMVPCAVKVFDVRTGAVALATSPFEVPVCSVAYSPDGRFFVTGGGDAYADGDLRVWDARSATECYRLDGHRSPVLSCTYTPDGRWILSCSLDGALKVWDARAGNQVAGTMVPVSHSTLTVRQGARVVDVGSWEVELSGFEPGTPVVTATVFAELEDPLVRCAWCARRSPVALAILDGITRLSHDARATGKPASLVLPDDAWLDQSLHSSCPHCTRPLVFNPFIVDTRDAEAALE